jgi:glutamate-1-semialdehyde aminotransferase
MPYLSFAGETDHQFTLAWAAECAARGVFVHSKHNWFMSTALSEDDIDSVLVATDGPLVRWPRCSLSEHFGQPAGVTAIGAR